MKATKIETGFAIKVPYDLKEIFKRTLTVPIGTIRGRFSKRTGTMLGRSNARHPDRRSVGYLMIDRRLIAAALACFSLNALSSDAQIAGTVVRIADGDTLSILDSARREHRVRLAEIDAPELSGQAFGARAKQMLSDLCFQRTANVDIRTTDRYGRLVGTVRCDGVDANAAMVKNGMAWVFTRYAAPKSPLIELERQARLEERGLWRDESPVPPWQWRRGAKVAD